MYFSVNVSFASLPLFVPTIISEMGTYTKQQSNGLSAPPYLLCLFMIILLTWLSDRYKMRGPFVFLAAMIAAIGDLLVRDGARPSVPDLGARSSVPLELAQLSAS